MVVGAGRGRRHRSRPARERHLVITDRLPLHEAPRGFELFLSKADGCEKVVLHA